MTTKQEIDTANDCLVSVQGERVLILNPQRVLTKDTALRLAAYIVAMTDYEQPDGQKFSDYLRAVKNA